MLTGTNPKFPFRFSEGDTVWVRDAGRTGFRIVEAKVEERHYHPNRNPWYPHGEGYQLDGDLKWSCYPGCRVYGSREEAIAARLPKDILAAAELEYNLVNELPGPRGFYED